MSLAPLPSPAFNTESLRDRVDSATAGVTALDARVAVTEAFGPRLDAAEAGLDAAPAAYASLAALQAATAPDRGVTLAGLPLTPDAYTPGSSTLLAANLRRFAPADGVLRLSMVSDDAGLVADAKSHILTMFADAEARGWEARITAARDPAITAWEADYIRHTLAADLRVSFDPTATIYSKTSFQQFACNGSQKVFPITAWAYAGRTSEPVGVMIVTGGVETGLTETADFTVTETSPGVWSVTTTATYATGTTLVVCSSRGALGFVTDDPDADITVYGHGGRFDLRRSGYVLAQAARSGLTFNDVKHVRWTGMIHVFGDPASAWDAANPLARRGDSGVTTLGCTTVSFEHVRAEYLNDLGLYVSGGGLGGASDDGLWTRVGFIEANRCATAFKNSRQHASLIVDACHANECQTGMIYGVTGGLDPIGTVQVGSIRGERIARRLLDIRATVAPVTVGSAVVRDIGYQPDGSAATLADGAALYLSGARAVTVGHLGVTFKAWSPVAGRPAVQLAGTGNSGNRVLSGYVEGCDIGLTESGGTTNDAGNSVTLTMKDVTTPQSIEAGSTTEYDLTILTESAGTITHSYRRRRGKRQAFSPELYLSGDALGGQAHATQSGTYTIDDHGRCTVSLEVQATITHGGGGKELRCTLPVSADNLDGNSQVLTLAHYTGVNPPGDDMSLVAELVEGQSYFRLRYWYDDASADGATGTITDANVISGSTVRLLVTGTFFRAETP